MNTEAGKIQGNLWSWGVQESMKVVWGNYDLADEEAPSPPSAPMPSRAAGYTMSDLLGAASGGYDSTEEIDAEITGSRAE